MLNLQWLRNASIEEVNAVLGAPDREMPVSAGDLNGYDREWKLWGDAVIFRRVDTADRPAILVGCYAAGIYPFSLERALDLAGLPHEYSVAPTALPDGIVQWTFWPDVGRVRIDFTMNAVSIAVVPSPDGGAAIEKLLLRAA